MIRYAQRKYETMMYVNNVGTVAWPGRETHPHKHYVEVNNRKVLFQRILLNIGVEQDCLRDVMMNEKLNALQPRSVLMNYNLTL